jgi:hemerythrin-like domain-containing protein
MKPARMLIFEHRIIERMIVIIQSEISKIEKGRIIDAPILDSIVDFLKFYINTTHHVKEDYLFSVLQKKNMTKADLKIMQQLINEHSYMETAIEDIVKAETEYFEGMDTIGIIITTFNALAALYPRHITNEEKNFFPNTENYLSPSELDEITKEFKNFDSTMIHKKYRSLIEELKAIKGKKYDRAIYKNS